MDPNGSLQGAASLAALAEALVHDALATEASNLARRYGVLLRSAADNATVFSPRGWALESMGVTLLDRARHFAKAGDLANAEEVLASFWDDKAACQRVVKRVRYMARRLLPQVEHFGRRSDLLTAAVDHHSAGAYAASILIVLTQVEGITADVTGGKMFFSKRPTKQADVVDPTLYAALEGTLDVARASWSAGVPDTQVTGNWSRHGALHGRELGYDNRVNSARAWSLLDGVVAWAMRQLDRST